MPTVIFIDHRDALQTAEASDGGDFVKLCDEVKSPIPFYCRRARCGTCRIAILAGAEELLPPEERELSLLKVFGLSPRQYRLACQAKMRPGLATLQVRPLGKRAPQRYSLWVPITWNLISKEMYARVNDATPIDIRITGTAELHANDVVLVIFQSPSAEKSQNVVGRLISVEPIDDIVGTTRNYMTEIEFFEPNETLMNLFKTVEK